MPSVRVSEFACSAVHFALEHPPLHTAWCGRLAGFTVEELKSDFTAVDLDASVFCVPRMAPTLAEHRLPLKVGRECWSLSQSCVLSRWTDLTLLRLIYARNRGNLGTRPPHLIPMSEAAHA